VCPLCGENLDSWGQRQSTAWRDRDRQPKSEVRPQKKFRSVVNLQQSGRAKLLRGTGRDPTSHDWPPRGTVAAEGRASAPMSDRELEDPVIRPSIRCPGSTWSASLLWKRRPYRQHRQRVGRIRTPSAGGSAASKPLVEVMGLTVLTMLTVSSGSYWCGALIRMTRVPPVPRTQRRSRCPASAVMSGHGNAGRPPPRQALLQLKRAKCPDL
jgi:hypothetical protein